MTELAASNLTYVINDRVRIGKRYFVQATITFGDGALTYPAGGVPLTTLKLGFRRGINSLVILESDSNALLYEWDRTANTICIYSETRSEASGAIAACTLEVYAVGW